MKRINRAQNQKGFTLIELLVVVAIIGFLSTVVLGNLSRARARARDSVRRQTLRELQKGLELYFSSNGIYPVQASYTSSEQNDGAPYSANYIPGMIAGGFVQRLPNDPLGGGNPVCGGSWKRAFLYISNGTDYKLLSHCSPETGTSASDGLYDPVRPTHAWQVSSPGGYNW